MISKTRQSASPRYRPAAFWLGVLSIAWLQLSVAAHQFDHDAGFLGETCQLCLQLDRSDDTDVCRTPALAAPAASSSIPVALHAPVAEIDSTRLFQPRAPPQL